MSHINVSFSHISQGIHVDKSFSSVSQSYIRNITDIEKGSFHIPPEADSTQFFYRKQTTLFLTNDIVPLNNNTFKTGRFYPDGTLFQVIGSTNASDVESKQEGE